MRSAAALCISAAAFLIGMDAACAEDAYYVELGRDLPAAEAQAEWQALSSHYRSQLGRLHYYPKKVLQAGTSVATRIQAGPIANREAAEKLCNHMFRHNVSCFVIEGLEKAPPTEVLSLSEEAETQSPVAVPPPEPVAGEEAPEQAAAAPAAPVELPWLKHENPRPSGKAEVEVAEAVRVPLSEANLAENAPVNVRALPELHDNTPAWLHVSAFPDEDMAMAFWQGLRDAAPRQARKLHVRMSRPLLATGGSQTTLNIGPFAGHSEASAFCRDGVQAINPQLDCSIGDEATPQSPPPEETHYARADAYNAGRDSLAGRRAPAENPQRTFAAESLAHKIYWVQVLAAPSQMEALRQWEDMRRANADVLNGRRSSISATLADRGTYVVRVGPMTNDGDAINLCANLKNRGVDCHVLLYSGR